MNKKVISKCLAELEKPEPNISYVRGMLETALDMVEETNTIQPGSIKVIPGYPQIIHNPTPAQLNLDVDLAKEVTPSKILEMERMINAS